MAKCKAESIRNEVVDGLVKVRPDLEGDNVRLKLIGEAAFKIAKAELMSKAQENKIDATLADRLDTLRVSKGDKATGTIEKEKIKGDVPKINKRTLNIGGLSIPYETVDAGSISNLASTNAGTGRIRIQEGLTAERVAEYLLNSEEVEGASKETKSKTAKTRGIVVGLLYREYGIYIMDVLRAMKDNDQLLRKFLLLHEYSHTLQLKKSGSKDAFKEAYNKDPVKFELDADLFALKALKSEIDLIKDMADEDFSLTKAGYTVEKSTNTSSTINEETVANENTLQGTPIADVGDQIGDNEGTAGNEQPANSEVNVVDTTKKEAKETIFIPTIDDFAFQHSTNLPMESSDKKLAEAVKDRLADMYPEISVATFDKLVDENGIEVIGRAIGSAVEYNPSKAGLDTLPHEYAHIYVNILEKTTFVSNLISKVAKDNNASTKEAKEIIVVQMGENYVHKARGGTKEISKGLLSRLWDKIISYLSNTKAVDVKRDINILAERFYNGVNREAIRTTPKEGFAKVDTEATFTDQPFAAEVLSEVMKVTKENGQFTGSAALALQGSVYRKGKNGITDLHDLDVAVTTKKVMEDVEKMLWNSFTAHKIYDFGLKEQATRHISTLVVVPKTYKIPASKIKRNDNNRVIAYTITDSNGKEVGTYEATVNVENNEISGEKTTGLKAVIVDLLEDSSGRIPVKYASEALKTTLYLSKYEDIFTAKEAMHTQGVARDKDITDRALFIVNKENTKQKDDTMSSNIVDRTTNNIVKEAKECANNGM